jgi:signal transduction histidine kinase
MRSIASLRARFRTRSWLTPQQADVGVVTLLLLWALPNVPWWWRPAGHTEPTPATLGALGLALLQSVPFLWRRKTPIRIAWLELAILAVRANSHADLTSTIVSVLVAAYGIGAYSSRSRRAARMLGMLTIFVAASLAFVSHEARAGMPVALLGAALLGGESVAARRAEQKAAIASARSAERTQIARELHDVLAHQLSAIAVQAGSARVAWQTSGSLGDTDPAEVLGTVEKLAREAMGELGHLLGMLRKDRDDVLARRPAPGLRDLEGLIDAGQASGLELSLTVDGVARPLPASIDLAAYRIVQEATTNAARHAPGAVARIAVRFEADAVKIDVVNGPARLPVGLLSGSGTGRGLTGMRERAELHDGRFQAGPQVGGGFAVSARLPVKEENR